MPKTIRRLWLPALGLLLLAGLVVGLIYWWPPPRTRVVAMLHLDARPQAIAFDHPAETPAEFQTYQKTQGAFLKSRLVINSALRDPKVADLHIVRSHSDLAGWLDKKLKVDFTASPEIMTVSLEGPEPSELKILLDAIINAYLNEVVNRERTQTQKMVDQLKDWAERYDQRIKRYRDNLRSLKQTIGADDDPPRRQLMQAEYNQAVQDIARLRSEICEVRVQLAALEGDGTAAGPAEVEDAVEQDPLLRKLTEREAQMEEVIEETRGGAAQGDRDAELQKQLRQQQRLRQLIERRRKELRPRVEGRLREKARLEASRQQTRLRARLKGLEDLQRQLSGEVARLANESKGAVRYLGVDEITQDIAHLEEVARTLKTRAERLTIELEAPNRIYPLQQATVCQD